VSAANLGGHGSRLGFMEDLNDLFFGVSGSLHGLGLLETLYPEPA
jgi:hypothetical protein